MLFDSPGWLERYLDKVPSQLGTRILDIVLGIVVVFISYFLAKGAQKLAWRATKTADLRPGIRGLVSRFAFGIVLVIGLSIALTAFLPSIDLGQVFGALGIGTLIVGFALRDIIENFVAGVLILATRPFRLGDQIQSGDDWGTVTEIKFRSTTIECTNGRVVIIPNSDLYTNRITVRTANDHVRHAIEINVANFHDIEAVRADIVKVVSETEGVNAEPAAEALVTHIDDYSTRLLLRFWMGPPPLRTEVRHVTDRALTRVANYLRENDIRSVRPVNLTYNIEVPYTKDNAP